MTSLRERIGGSTWRPGAEPPSPPEETETEANEELGVRMPLMRHLAYVKSMIFIRIHRLVLLKRRNKRARRPRLLRVREAVQLGTLQKLVSSNDTQAAASEIYARARVERAELTECYAYEQEISRNPSKRATDSAKGHILLSVPYDGYKYFTREAHADVVNATKVERANEDTEAVIGHLLLADYGNTDLDTILNLRDNYGAIQIRVPIGLNGKSNGTDHLTSDRQSCVIAYDYTPSSQQSRLVPIDVQIELLDPDNFSDLPSDLLAEQKRAEINDVVSSMTQQVSFRSYLCLCITVSLHLPSKSRDNNLTPKITKMSLGWPTITSLDALSLTVDGESIPIKYNPEVKCIEWSDIDVPSADDPDDSGDIQLYRNSGIVLFIKQPGELYREQSLTGQVEVEIPGYLMSGLDGRLYNVTGSLSRATKPEFLCKISTTINLILDDAFAKRKFSPWQQLYFDEIVPEDARITDIVTALQDRGFLVESQVLANDRQDRFLMAKRREGPDFMFMWVLIERRRYQTERENKVPGGHTYKSVFESGELRVFIRGTLPRDSCELTHEMNALQLALRERFARVRARR
jgi:hypothetical protein